MTDTLTKDNNEDTAIHLLRVDPHTPNIQATTVPPRPIRLHSSHQTVHGTGCHRAEASLRAGLAGLPLFAVASAKRIFYSHAGIVFAVAEVLGEDDITAERAASLEDRGVPVRDAKTPMCRKCGQHQARCDGRDGKAHERLDQLDSLLMGERIPPAFARRLDVELLQNLNG